ncbi:MAG: NAD(P)/FAD-dependent oxidoreductase, partial [Halobacteria archaeon]|nr:NAD(P)/FAD-dependent oxidoreductase [Halobacteria archaeon]
MPSSEYDVAIAGAGPAGLQAARDIASRDYDVLVLETEPRDEFPSTSNKSTAGTFPPMMASFDIPDKVVQNYTERVVLESPNSYFSMDAAGAVMDFAEFKQYLVDECEERGAEFEFGTRVNGPIKENGKVKGIRYNGDESVRSKVSIDATGPAAAISRELGLTELPRNRQAIGIEYEMRGVEPETSEEGYSDVTDAMMLRLNHELAPGGYSWIFHTGGDTAKVGLCYIMNESFNTYGDSETGVESYMEEFVRRDPRLRDAEKMEGRMHRGSAHILLPDGMSTDGFMAVG